MVSIFKKYPLLAPVLFLSLFVLQAQTLEARTIEKNETWRGRIDFREDVVVGPDVVVTIEKGADLRFSKTAGLIVSGSLVARGSEKDPIVFRGGGSSEPGTWPGIAFQASSHESLLENVRVEGASQGLTVSDCAVKVLSSTLRGGEKGILSGVGARVLVQDVTIRDMSQGGVDASVRSQVQVIDCRLEKLEGFGIQAGQQAVVQVRNNRIADVKFGILLSGDFPPLEGNQLRNCEVGIGITQAGPGVVVRGNTVKDCKTGISCRQFSAPAIEGNTVESCDVGIECFQGASPAIRQNRLSRNNRALSCIQMCNPDVQRNDFLDNDTGAYLHLSSYAKFQENNFERNRLHIELDNMSYDWEVRARKKPTRNRQAQNETLVKQGRAQPGTFNVIAESEGFVSAKNNYWGGATTKEMATRGLDANISTIVDAFDVPTRTYEGWPGEYKQDRVRFDGWKETRIAGTGP